MVRQLTQPTKNSVRKSARNPLEIRYASNLTNLCPNAFLTHSQRDSFAKSLPPRIQLLLFLLIFILLSHAYPAHALPFSS